MRSHETARSTQTKVGETISRKTFRNRIRGKILVILGSLLLLLGPTIWIADLYFKAATGATPSISPGLLPFTIIFFCCYGGATLKSHGKRILAPCGRDLLKSDLRPPIVFLRSFHADGTPLNIRSSSDFSLITGITKESLTEDEVFAETFKGAGPFVAAGKPGEPLPQLGAARFYLTTAWKDEIGVILRKARCIIVRAGTSGSLKWEIEHLIKHVRPERILIYLPYAEPKSTFVTKDQHKEYAKTKFEEFRSLINPILPTPIPSSIGLSRFIYFDPDWQPRKLHNRQTGSRGLIPNLRNELRPFLARLDIEHRLEPPKPEISVKRIIILMLVIIGVAILIVAMQSQ